MANSYVTTEYMQVGCVPEGVKANYHHGDLRRVLLTQGAALLEEVGSEAMSIRELARRAGVSPRAPYQHFADKEALLSALATEGFRAFAATLAAAEQAAPPGHEIEEQAVAYVRFALAAPGRFRLMFGSRRPAREGDLAVAKAAAFGTLQARVDRQQAAGADGRALAVGCWSLAHGLAVLLLDGLARDEIDGEDDEVIVRRVAAALLGPALSPDRSASADHGSN